MCKLTSVDCVILGAGTASRMGKTKQLLKLGNKPLLQHVIEKTLEENFSTVSAVIGHDAKEIQESILIADHRFRWLVNDNYHEGQSTSLKQGVHSLGKTTRHIMVFLGDLPFIQKRTIQHIFDMGLSLANEREEPYIVRPVYNKIIGHPVFFGNINKQFFEKSNGDHGAKIIMKNITCQKRLSVDDKGIIWDIDTPEEYESAKQEYNH